MPTKKNRADVLTRVKKEWLMVPEDVSAQSQSPVCCTGVLNIKELRGMHHMGVDRTLFLARKVDPMVTREAVRRVVSGCERCQSIDPAPVVHERGEIHVNENWRRLALDVTHYRQGLYLSMIDCGPGRVAIWRELRTETAVEIGSILNEIFLERGPVDEVLMDNSTVFRSGTLKSMFDKWKVKRFFRAAYRPGGNGIVERHHRTIKAIAERGRISPAEAVFWYNVSPRAGQSEDSVPQKSVFKYEWRQSCVAPQDTGDRSDVDIGSIRVGEEVWVKPPNARCTSQWGKGRVTGVNSRNNVMVDGVPRHILDVRRVVSSSSDGSDDEQEEVEVGGAENESMVMPYRPRRER